MSALRKLNFTIIAHLWNQRKKQAEPAKPGRPESIGTSKRLKSHREKKIRQKEKTAEKKHERKEISAIYLESRRLRKRAEFFSYSDNAFRIIKTTNKEKQT